MLAFENDFVRVRVGRAVKPGVGPYLYMTIHPSTRIDPTAGMDFVLRLTPEEAHDLAYALGATAAEAALDARGKDYSYHE